MKRLFLSMMLFLSLSSLAMAVEAQAQTVVAPACDNARIADYEIAIKKDEYRAQLVRAGIYVGSAAIALYAVHHFLSLPDGVLQKTSPQELIDSAKAAAVLSQVTARLQALEVKAYGSGPKEWWPKRFASTIFTMFVQSAAVSALMSVGGSLKNKFFYGNKLADFLVRSTDLIATKDALERYADIFALADFPQERRAEVQELVQQRIVGLCHDVEKMIAYMHVVKAPLTNQSSAFSLAEQLLITRADSSLTALWKYAVDTTATPAELARGIALTMNIFEHDCAQAINAFDDALVQALAA